MLFFLQNIMDLKTGISRVGIISTLITLMVALSISVSVSLSLCLSLSLSLSLSLFQTFIAFLCKAPDAFKKVLKRALARSNERKRSFTRTRASIFPALGRRTRASHTRPVQLHASVYSNEKRQEKNAHTGF